MIYHGRVVQAPAGVASRALFGVPLRLSGSFFGASKRIWTGSKRGEKLRALLEALIRVHRAQYFLLLRKVVQEEQTVHESLQVAPDSSDAIGSLYQPLAHVSPAFQTTVL